MSPGSISCSLRSGFPLSTALGTLRAGFDDHRHSDRGHIRADGAICTVAFWARCAPANGCEHNELCALGDIDLRQAQQPTPGPISEL